MHTCGKLAAAYVGKQKLFWPLFLYVLIIPQRRYNIKIFWL